MAEQTTRRGPTLKNIVEWKLQSDVDQTRDAIIRRARMLAERLTRLANGLEADPDFTYNTIGELQGNGVELDTWCTKLGFARETLKLVKQAAEEEAKG